jgi:hypothetical protein
MYLARIVVSARNGLSDDNIDRMRWSAPELGLAELTRESPMTHLQMLRPASVFVSTAQAPEMIEPVQMPRPIGDFFFITEDYSGVRVYTREGLYAQDPGYVFKNLAGETFWSQVVRNPANGLICLIVSANGGTHEPSLSSQWLKPRCGSLVRA